MKHVYTYHIAEEDIHTYIVLDKNGNTILLEGLKPGCTYRYVLFGCHEKDTWDSTVTEYQGIPSYTDIKAAWHMLIFENWLYQRQNRRYKSYLFKAVIPKGTKYCIRHDDTDGFEGTGKYILYSECITVDVNEMSNEEMFELEHTGKYSPPLDIEPEFD